MGGPSLCVGVRVSRGSYALSVSDSNRDLRGHNCHISRARTPLGRILTTNVVLGAN